MHAALLSYIQTLRDGSPLRDVSGVAVSPDGKHVYTASTGDQAVAAFLRNPDDSLTLIDVEHNGLGGTAGLTQAESVAISHDGANIYVTGIFSDELAVFARDGLTGETTFLESHAIDGPRLPIVSHDGANVYVPLFSEGAVVVFARDLATGRLVQMQVLKGGSLLHGTSSVAISPDDNYVYATGSSFNRVVILGREPSDGTLSQNGAVFDNVGGFDGLRGAFSIAVSPDGNHVYVAGLDEDAVAVLRRDIVTGSLSFVEVHRNGLLGVTGIERPVFVALSADGATVYVVSSSGDSVAVFSREGGTGALTFMQALPALPAESLAISSDGTQVYAAAQDLVAFDRDTVTGELSNGVSPSGAAGLFGSDGVALSTDGAHVYVAAAAGSVVTLHRNPGNGGLTFAGALFDDTDGVDGLDGAGPVVVSPDDAHVYVAAKFESALAAFERNPTTGALAFVQALNDDVDGVDGIAGISGIAVSPDGNNIYVAGRDDDGVAVFARDSVAGTLSFVELHRDGVGGIDSLDSADAVAVSPDGQHVYATAEGDDAVTVFSRAADGRLTFVEAQRDGVAGVTGLNAPLAVVVSPEGANVYTIGGFASGIAVFARDASTGALTFVERVGAATSFSLTVSPDGSHVFAVGVFADTLSAYRRAPATGQLQSVQTLQGQLPVGPGLGGAFSVAVSPDSAYVYVAAQFDGGVSAFGLCGNGAIDGSETCDDGNRVDGDGCSASCASEVLPVRCAAARRLDAATDDEREVLTDQSGAVDATILRPQDLCLPAGVDGVPRASYPDHLLTYHIRPRNLADLHSRLPIRSREVTSAYGTHALDIMRPKQLMVPTAVQDSTTPSALGAPVLDSFTCYRVRRARGSERFSPVEGVQILDGLGFASVTLRRPLLLCLPTNVGGTPAPASGLALLCYSYGPAGRRHKVTFTNNALGPEQLRLGRQSKLCVPATVAP